MFHFLGSILEKTAEAVMTQLNVFGKRNLSQAREGREGIQHTRSFNTILTS